MIPEGLNRLAYDVVGAAYEVRKVLGRFLYEKTYEIALQVELKNRGINSIRQAKLPIVYKGIEIQDAYKIDLLVEGILPVELKSISQMTSADAHQILSYMTFGKYNMGLLMNFAAEDFVLATSQKDSSFLSKGIYRFILD